MRSDAIRAVWLLQLSVRDEPLEVWTIHDAQGLLDASNDLPDCASDPSLCDLHIDASSAVAIAIASTKVTPLDAPTVKLLASRMGGFVWRVSIEDESRPGSGVSVHVHAATGEASGVQGWFVVPARRSDRASK